MRKRLKWLLPLTFMGFVLSPWWLSFFSSRAALFFLSEHSWQTIRTQLFDNTNDPINQTNLFAFTQMIQDIPGDLAVDSGAYYSLISGKGFCDQKCAVVKHLLRESIDSGAIHFFDQHTLIEVYKPQSITLLDPTTGQFFVDSTGQNKISLDSFIQFPEQTATNKGILWDNYTYNSIDFNSLRSSSFYPQQGVRQLTLRLSQFSTRIFGSVYIRFLIHQTGINSPALQARMLYFAGLPTEFPSQLPDYYSHLPYLSPLTVPPSHRNNAYTEQLSNKIQFLSAKELHSIGAKSHE